MSITDQESLREQPHSSPSPADPKRLMGPVRPAERIEVVDVLRGLAIFGMFVVNMSHDLPWAYMFVDNSPGAPVLPEVLVLETLGKGKFFALFAFFFGFGFAIQGDRAMERGVGFTLVALRRMIVLLAIGIVFSLFVPWGILIGYALMGFVLIMIPRSLSPRVLLLGATACFVLYQAFTAVGYSTSTPAQDSAEERLAIQERRQVVSTRRERAVQSYLTGTVGEIVELHARTLQRRFSSWGLYVGLLGGQLPLMLLGMYTWRRRVFQDISGNIRFFRKVFWWGLGLGVVGMTIHRWFSHILVDPPFPRVLDFIGEGLWEIGAPAMGFSYAAAIVLLTQRDTWVRRFKFLAAVGRLSFSNYIFCGFIFTFVFYGYGLGLYADLGPLAGALLAILIFPIHILWSAWWLRHFRFGPIEWLWRTLTYGKPQPMRTAAKS